MVDSLESSSQLTKILPGNFFLALRWWTRCCFLLGFPFHKLSYNAFVHFYVKILPVVNIVIGLFTVVGFTIVGIEHQGDSMAYQISNHLINLALFISNSVLHMIITCKLEMFQNLFQALNQQLVVDRKFKKRLQIATCVLLIYMVITLSTCAVFAAFSKKRGTSLSEITFSLLWTLWIVIEIYPEIMSHTISLVITALGYQFSLLKTTIETENQVNWKELYARHLKLCRLAANVQKCFNTTLTIIMSCTLLRICLNFFFLAEHVVAQNFSASFYRIVTIMVMRSIRCIGPCVAADYLRDQASSLKLSMAEADFKHLYLSDINSAPTNSTAVKTALAANIRGLQYLTSISVGGFCRLGKPLILTMLAVILSYFVLLRQVRSSEAIPQ